MPAHKHLYFHRTEQWVAFLYGIIISSCEVSDGNSESQVTEDGKRNAVLNGIPDWVYEEEFSFNRALEFSADSKMLAYIRFDSQQLPFSQEAIPISQLLRSIREIIPINIPKQEKRIQRSVYIPSISNRK